MNDPRIALDLLVESDVFGPFEATPTQRDGTGDDGGTLDVGIIARRADGTKIVIGEIWAACPTYRWGEKTRIDAASVAARLIKILNDAHSDGGG